MKYTWCAEFAEQLATWNTHVEPISMGYSKISLHQYLGDLKSLLLLRGILLYQGVIIVVN